MQNSPDSNKQKPKFLFLFTFLVPELFNYFRLSFGPYHFVELEIVGARADVDAVNHAARGSGGPAGSCSRYRRRRRSLRHSCAYSNASNNSHAVSNLKNPNGTEKQTNKPTHTPAGHTPVIRHFFF
jgi:hypothetical protein